MGNITTAAGRIRPKITASFTATIFEMIRQVTKRQAIPPVVPRDASRLLHVLNDRLEDRRFLDFPKLLRAGDLLVFNDTKVIPARLIGRRGMANVEATLHQRQGLDRWRAFVRPARRL